MDVETAALVAHRSELVFDGPNAFSHWFCWVVRVSQTSYYYAPRTMDISLILAVSGIGLLVVCVLQATIFEGAPRKQLGAVLDLLHIPRSHL